jgi:hypothetical protein
MSNDQRVSDLVISLIRTWVPIGVGSALGWLASAGDVVVPPGASAATGALVAGLCAAAYYALARSLEQAAGTGAAARIGRGIGRFMLGGVVRQPVYVAPAPDLHEPVTR